jgi:hypothetical protein
MIWFLSNQNIEVQVGWGRITNESPCYNRAMPGLTQGASAIFSLVTFGALLGFPLANAQKERPPDVPDAIHAPPGERVVLAAHASGSQIYTCQSGADSKFIWTLKGPDAELRDAEDKVIGNHFAGPTWRLKDGSELTGKAVAHVDSPDPGSIPWLLVNAVAHGGKGLLNNVTTIQRVHTHGGQPPAGGCDEPHRNAETKVSYTADYYFYAPAK